ncbi:MAG: glycosyltransferase [Aquiluna sp.]|nr:glycosyltransferase [Aquiluna sp.]MCF8546269.1 glycosyltransferase [Aquiluna sp.]
MASLFVAAIVVSHAQAENLNRVLETIENQDHPINQVVVVETGGDQQSTESAKRHGFSSVMAPDVRLGLAIQSGIDSLAQAPGWLWILHDDSFPEPTALSHLARAAEISPSVAIIGPKLLDARNPIRIQQLGLTVTKTGRPFLQVQNEYDQGQFDSSGDSFAVSTAGMLISLDAWQRLGGLNDKTPPLAQDLELGAKARAAGFRVVVEPKARVLHHQLSASGKRDRKWLGGSLTQAISKSHLHMATLLSPALLVVLGYLMLPLIFLASIPVLLLAKRPGRIFGQLKGWLWAWGTISSRLAARRQLRGLGSVKSLGGLKAGFSEVRKRRKARFSQEPMRDSDSVAGFFSSNSGWLSIIVLAASARLFPQGALLSDSLSPIGRSFDSIWNATAIYLHGGSIPSDPFGQFYLLMAAIYPQSPSIALASFVFAAPTLAFIASWQLGSIFFQKIWVRSLIGLTYALVIVLPAAMNLQIVELVSLTFSPWAIYFLIRASRAYNNSRAWRWTGLAGIALVLVAISSIVLFLLLAVVSIGLGIYRHRRSLIILAALIPGAALVSPWVIWIVKSGNWELLTVSAAASSGPFQFELGNPVVIAGIIILATSMFGIFRGNLKLVSVLTALMIFGFAAALYQPWVSSYPLLGFALLCALVLTGIGLDSLNLKRVSAIFGAVLFSATSIGGLYFGALASSQIDFGDDRLMPALVVAASEVSPNVKTLKITAGEQITAEVIEGDGISIDEVHFLDWIQPSPVQEVAEIAKLTALLVAANQNGVAELLNQTQIDFILLEGEDPLWSKPIESSLNSMVQMQPAGNTKYGVLWKTEVIKTQDVESPPRDQIRDLMLLVIAGFALLAIPTTATLRGYRRLEVGEMQ